MKNNYEQPAPVSPKSTTKSFINTDTNKEVLNTEIKYNRKPPTYIQDKDGKLIPINLREYKKNAKEFSEEAQAKLKSAEDFVRGKTQDEIGM